MQAVILAAGQSSRFYPLNGVHKSMVRLMGKPILEHTIYALKKLKINDIILVTDSKGIIQEYFGDGNKFGISIKYLIQQDPHGAGNALLLAKELIKENFLLLNPTHVDIDKLGKELIITRKKSDAVLFVEERQDAWKYGVVKVENDRLVDLIEKPKRGEEPSKLCVVGIYMFPESFLQTLSETPQEHYQLEKAIANFAKTNGVQIIEIKDKTVTLKYPWDLLKMKDFLFKNIKSSMGKNINIASSAEIIGEVVIEDGAQIMEGAKIKGPCYIGRNAYIGNHAVLRNGVDVEENSVVGAYLEIKNTILMANSKTHSGFIGDSIIGENCRIGAQFCSSNVRLDRETVKSIIKNEKIDTGLKSLGMITGKNVHIGIKCSVMPGVIVGNNAVIGPSTTVLQNVDDDTKYYSKFQEVITKK